VDKELLVHLDCNKYQENNKAWGCFVFDQIPQLAQPFFSEIIGDVS
jgi:hypothetical protein